MCAKDDLIRRKEEPATAESITAKDSNYVNTFSSDFAFSPLIARGNVSNANILSLIAFIISHRLFADKLNIQQSLPDRATVVLIIISRSTPSTLLARFIPTTKIHDPLLKKNAAKSGILLACRTEQFTQLQQERCLNKGHDDFIHSVNYFSTILVTQESGSTQLNERFCQVMHSTSLKRFNNKRAFIELIAVVSLLFVSKAPFALHFIHAVCDLVILAQYKRALERMNIFKEEFRVYQRTLGEEKNFNYPKALDSICTRANSEAYYITIVKQFYSITNKKEKHIAYIRAFSKVLLFNNNEQINNTTRILTFKFYDLSTIIRLVHLVLRDLPNSTTHTTMSYYVNNYINWDEYNCLYLLTFNINLLRTLREYQQKRTRNN
ncbi:hypothetical protein HBI59_136890 [Parastagonospora nodorum]|nr:hypothetical protein HBI59_136890 [Parastagonospora nodorum]